MKTFLILGVEDGNIHLYQTQAFNLATAKRHFEREIITNDWQPFETVYYSEVSLLDDLNKKDAIEKIGIVTASQIVEGNDENGR